MDVPILLVLGAGFSGYRHTALATRHKTAEYLGLGFLYLRMSTLCEDFLCFVEQTLVDEWCIAAFVQFAAIEKVPVIEGVGEDEANAVVVDAVAMPTADVVVVQKLPDIFKARRAFGVQLERGTDNRRFLPVEDDSFPALVVSIPCRSRPRKVALPCFCAKTARGVCGEVADKLIRHPELNRHHENVICGIVCAVVSLDMRYHAALKKPLNLPAVYRITRQAVYFPTHDSLCFAGLDTRHHLGKDRTAGHFRAPLFYELLCDFQPLPPSESTEFAQLRFNGQDLFVLDIGAFAGVEEVS